MCMYFRRIHICIYLVEYVLDFSTDHKMVLDFSCLSHILSLTILFALKTFGHVVLEEHILITASISDGVKDLFKLII